MHDCANSVYQAFFSTLLQTPGYEAKCYNTMFCPTLVIHYYSYTKALLTCKAITEAKKYSTIEAGEGLHRVILTLPSTSCQIRRSCTIDVPTSHESQLLLWSKEGRTKTLSSFVCTSTTFLLHRSNCDSWLVCMLIVREYTRICLERMVYALDAVGLFQL